MFLYWILFESNIFVESWFVYISIFYLEIVFNDMFKVYNFEV